jgi:hypothetical protein
LRFTVSIDLELWVLPKNSCLGPVILYSAPNSFTDILRLGADPICIFLVGECSVAVNGTVSIEVFSMKNNSVGPENCAGVCTLEFEDRMWMSLDPNQVDVTFSGKFVREGNDSASCGRDFIPLLRGNEIEAQDGLVSANMFACEGEESLPVYVVVLVGLGITVLLPVMFALMLARGWFSKMRLIVRKIASGAKDVNRVLTSKVNLRGDGEEELLTVGLEEEEVHTRCSGSGDLRV